MVSPRRLSQRTEQSLLARARGAERSARSLLEEGCEEDLACLDGLIEGPLSIARNRLYGSSRPVARRIVAQCVDTIVDAANLRFRARFRIYAETVWRSESSLIARPRRITLPRLDIALSVSKAPPLTSSAAIDLWTAELRAGLRAALRREVENAKGKVVRRVVASIARSRARRELRRP